MNPWQFFLSLASMIAVTLIVWLLVGLAKEEDVDSTKLALIIAFLTSVVSGITGYNIGRRK